MKGLSSAFAEAYTSWLSSVSQCCSPLASCVRHDRATERYSIEKQPTPVEIVQEQPHLVQPPLAPYYEHDPFRPSTRASARDRVRKSFSSTRTSFSVRKRLRSTSGSTSRRPQISAPSNFVHVYSESFQFPELQPMPEKRSSFHPLELHLYQSENDLTPILPLFHGTERILTPPAPAHLREGRDDDGCKLTRERSYSSLSFHVPRRGAPDDSPKTPPQNTPPKVPPKSRARAYTSPESEKIAERIASALLEKEKLQQLIDEVVERQSIYLGSRPSTAHSMARTVTDMEPMPAIPALPPSAPSFAERLSPSSDRPQTAPTRSPMRPRAFDGLSKAASPSTPTRVTTGPEDRPLQPPLPLVLRPPLRKKKSFSRVSTWLFPAGDHRRDLSFDSITNQPRPVKGREGFYQCVSASGSNSRRQSVSSVSSWSTEDDEKTVPTTWSPGSSPATGTAAQSSGSLLDRAATFGSKERPALTPTRTGGSGSSAGQKMATFGPRRESVGVAF